MKFIEKFSGKAKEEGVAEVRVRSDKAVDRNRDGVGSERGTKTVDVALMMGQEILLT